MKSIMGWKMKTFSFAVVLVSGALFFTGAVGSSDREFSPHFQAFCNDGDGPLSDWVASRYEAYIIGRDHELNNRGHRWDILVQQGETVTRVPVCARLTEGTVPDTLKLENTCGRCVKFTVSRTTAEGAVKTREIKVEPKKSRHFRKLANATVRVDAERDCGE